MAFAAITCRDDTGPTLSDTAYTYDVHGRLAEMAAARRDATTTTAFNYAPDGTRFTHATAQDGITTTTLTGFSQALEERTECPMPLSSRGPVNAAGTVVQQDTPDDKLEYIEGLEHGSH